MRLMHRLECAAAAHGGPVAIVGHSRRGLLARVLARRRPDLVSGVIALAARAAGRCVEPGRAQLEVSTGHCEMANDPVTRHLITARLRRLHGEP